MAQHGDDAVQVLRTIWSAGDQGATDADEICGPQKACRNMKHVSFDGFAEPGSDLGSAWRDKLRREGKLSESGQTVRDLILGPGAPR
jgi:hypothetical protein